MNIGKRTLFLATFLSVLIGIFPACREKASEQTASVRAMRIVTDDLGRQVSIPEIVTRVVSLAPNLTENIFAVGAGERLVGVTTFCNYPEAAKQIAKIGDTMTPNMESIVALKPDIVFVSTASQIENFTKTLEANGIAVYVSNPTTLDGINADLINLGNIFGKTDKANAVVADLNRRIDDVVKKLEGKERVRVFVQISREPLFTVGKESYLNELIAKAGGRSVTENVATAYPKISKETALALDPEAIILSESDDNLEPNEVFKNSKAVKNSRVYRVNADLLSRPGPRLVDALEEVGRDMHPNAFNKKTEEK